MASQFYTGLTPRGGRLDYTVLTGTRKRVSVVHRAPAEAPSEESPDLSGQIGRIRKEFRGELHVAVPASSTLLQVVDLPTQDAEEIAGMVDLRVEDLTPFPLDRTYVSWEVLARSETDSRVLIALAAHGAVDPWQEALHPQHLLAHRVDVDVLAWWRLMVHAQAITAEGARLDMVLDGEQTHLLAFDRGLPVAFRSLGPPAAWTAEILAEELDMVLADLEADRGLSEFEQLTVWHWGAHPAALDGLNCETTFGFACQTRNLGELPPLSEGVALRALESADGGIDLSPPSWKEEEAMRALRKRLLTGGAMVAAIWLIAITSLIVYVKLGESRVQDLKSQARIQEKPVQDVQALSQRVRSLSQFTDRTYSALECLRLVAEAMPARGRMQMTDCSYRKDRGMTFKGDTAGTGQDFYQLVEELGAASILKVEEYDIKRERGVMEFRVETEWRWPDEEAGTS